MGYIRETILHAQNAADATDSTHNIRTNSESLQVCLQNVEGWTNEILQLALDLNEMPFGPDMEPIVLELRRLGTTLLAGTDANQNGDIEAVAGECGADEAYKYGYSMADMQIYIGPDRTPPTGKETVSP